MLAAQELVRSAGSVARQQLEDFLQEYVLMLELKLFHLSRCGLSEMRGPLLAKARAYYTTQRCEFELARQGQSASCYTILLTLTCMQSLPQAICDCMCDCVCVHV